VMALTPAICEELAFRGFILSGLRHTGHRWRAIAGSSLFFGAAHGILQQSLSAAVLGMVLGYLVIQSGSLLTSIVFHLLYNSASMLMLIFASRVTEHPATRFLFRQTGEGPEYQPYVVVLSAAISAAILLWFRQLPCEPTSEERLQRALDRESVPDAPEHPSEPLQSAAALASAAS
jgi:sodium transport system permease protein